MPKPVGLSHDTKGIGAWFGSTSFQVYGGLPLLTIVFMFSEWDFLWGQYDAILGDPDKTNYLFYFSWFVRILCCVHGLMRGANLLISNQNIWKVVFGSRNIQIRCLYACTCHSMETHLLTAVWRALQVLICGRRWAKCSEETTLWSMF